MMIWLQKQATHVHAIETAWYNRPQKKFTFWQITLGCLVNVTKVQFSNCPYVWDMSFVASMPNLEFLDVAACYNMNSRRLHRGLKYCPKLRVLNLEHNIHLRTSHVISILMNDPNLEEVIIVGCIQIEAEDLFDVLNCLPKCLIFACSPGDLARNTHEWENLFQMFGCIAFTDTLKAIAE